MASGVFKHRSFKRSYREDYVRDLQVPGMMYHILYPFKLIFTNWKIFLPFLLIVVILMIGFVGLMSENTYTEIQKVIDQTAEETGANIGTFAKSGILLVSTVFTGGLSSNANAGAGVLVAMVFLIIWLVTIFVIRHKLAGNKIGLRDALYNSLSPLLSSFVVFIVAAIQTLPIMILIIAYSAAIETHFLDTPFYAFLFLAFAALMILLSGYFLSSSIVALVAVSAPGMYPLEALKTSSEVMVGRRIKFILRIISLLIAIAVMWFVVMMPLILFDLFMQQFEWTMFVPFIPICLVIMSCFTGIYVTVYFYVYYRWILDFDTKEVKNGKKRSRKKNK